MINKTKFSYGNDKHCVTYITCEESVESNVFVESSYMELPIYVNGITQSSVSPKFGSNSFLWSDIAPSGAGLSADTSSVFNFGKLDYGFDFWFSVTDTSADFMDVFSIYDANNANSYITGSIKPLTHGTYCHWKLKVVDDGVTIVDFQSDDDEFNHDTWYQANFSRYRDGDGECYSIYVGKTATKYTYWLTGATRSSIHDFNWTTPMFEVGGDRYNLQLKNIYIDSIRVSKGNARKWAIDIDDIRKPLYFTPNRAY